LTQSADRDIERLTTNIIAVKSVVKETLEEVAARIDVSVRYLREECWDQPWMLEGRGATEEEYAKWAKSKKGSCGDYFPLKPIQHYHGMCWLYKYFGRPCGVPFIPKCFCLTGQMPEGKMKHVTWKDARKAYDKHKGGKSS